MNVRLDFGLSGRFNIVEQTIFRLVLGGVKDVRTIKSLIPVCSDVVIANAIKRLVNYQILRANLETRILSISEPLLAMIEECLEQSQYLELPKGTEIIMRDGRAFITDETTKRQILNALLPGVNVGFLTKSIDFAICTRGLEDDR